MTEPRPNILLIAVHDLGPRLACYGQIAVAVLVILSATAAETFAKQGNEAKILQATEAKDYKIDREAVFTFAKEPVVTRQGDRVTISFESNGFCDVTVVAENPDGTILRHMASGVLGANAPVPFKKNSKAQTVVWDGKDDFGRYINDKDSVSIRVSLGLKPQFEKTLFWHPKKLVARHRHPRFVAQPEGVYVYEGGGIESIKLFSHEGKYIRTVYPFPADKVKQVKGLDWEIFADGWTVPKHVGYWRATYLPGGTGCTAATWGTAARAFAVQRGRIALLPWFDAGQRNKGGDNRLARLRTDGTTGDLSLQGGPINTPYPMHSAAFSPDGQWLYLAGPYRNVQPPFQAMPARVTWKHGVYRMKYEGNEPPSLWLGGDKPGKDDTHFNHPSSVCVDAEGRVYIADNHNDRVQIFSQKGDLLKSIPVKGPAILQLHHKTAELYVFSWTMSMGHDSAGGKAYKVPAVLRIFAPFKSLKPKLEAPIPLWNYREGLITTTASYTDELPYRATLDSYTDPPTIWMVPGATGHRRRTSMPDENVRRFHIKDGKFVLLDSWNIQVVKTIKEWQPPNLFRQRLHVDHRNGTLYSMEGKTNHQLVRIDPENGKVGIVNLPYTAEDMAIGYEGHIFLRCNRIIGRFNLDTMREVPFDYGEKRRAYWSSMAKKKAMLISAVCMPGNRPAYWHESGMGVNPRGEIVVSVCNNAPSTKRARGLHGIPKAMDMAVAKKYIPGIYPGRFRYAEIHIWDKHGKAVARDAAGQGVMDGHGTKIDSRGDIYFLAGGHRIYNGKKHFRPLTGCVIKFKRGHGRFISQSQGVIPVTEDRKPNFPPQLSCGTKGRFWVTDAEWIYPGAGFVRPGAPCQCWNTRFTVDIFGRVFIPESIRNQVAVLDTNGNLILHVGRYGNIDDGVPLVSSPRRDTQHPPRTLGGDEVSLVYANYVATHSDRRLFITDPGNQRIVSVKLGYHVNHKTALRKINDTGRR